MRICQSPVLRYTKARKDRCPVLKTSNLWLLKEGREPKALRILEEGSEMKKTESVVPVERIDQTERTGRQVHTPGAIYELGRLKRLGGGEHRGKVFGKGAFCKAALQAPFGAGGKGVIQARRESDEPASEWAGAHDLHRLSRKIRHIPDIPGDATVQEGDQLCPIYILSELAEYAY
jgi:hypothetical protein